MKNEKIVFNKYCNSDTNLTLLIELHQSISKGTDLENNLIYYDSNFENYLNSLFDSENHFFYVLYINDRIEGFVHIRYIDDFLFLNNIAVNNEFKGRGLGSKLMKYALKDISKRYVNETVFKLDVFRSNNIAVKWYKKLGFEEESEKKWFKFLSKSPSTISVLEKSKDLNGFFGLFDKEDKIGTIVLNNLILHKSDRYNDINLSEYNNILSDDSSFQLLSNYEELKSSIEIIDVSIRMKNTIKNVKNVLIL